ncbi:hypothetical protein MMC08_000325 [Hypocenomyce scalaris]|nr:hypothetical protein [Hypocenomyce scalaris]
MQFTEFFVRHLSWARTGVDVANTRMGEFPLTPEENLDHIKGIITREAVGCGDEKWREYLSHRRVHQAFTIQDFTGDDDDLDATGDEPEAAAGVEPEAAAGVEPKAAVEQDKYVGVEAVCLKCQ